MVHVHDLFQENDTAYIVMDFVEGQTLKAHLAKTGPLSWEQAQAIFFPAIRAMEQVHQAGLVHRDLSPDNLMLLPDGSVQILDLGAAKDLNVNSGASSMQVAKGGFSPLEQYSQRGGSGPWTDVYAMAATMYFSLTGAVPPNAVDRVDEDTVPWDLPQLAALPKGVLSALKGALAVSAKARTQSMGEFLSQLEAATPGPDPDPVPSKKALLAAIAAVLVVAILAGWLLRGAASPKQETTPETETTVPTEPESIFPLAIQEQTISAGPSHTAAIKRDGTAVVTETISTYNLSDWSDLVSICAGMAHIVGLKAGGTVVATGNNANGQCDVSNWENIVAIAAAGYHTAGLKADGTVVATGDNSHGQCDVSDWTNIVAISSMNYHTVGLKADGTVVSTQIGGSIHNQGQCDVSDWTDIIAIYAGVYHTVGLKADGTVVSTQMGNDRYNYGQCDISDWTDIVAICANAWHTVGLKADGTVISTSVRSGTYNFGQDDVSDWTDIRIPGTTR